MKLASVERIIAIVPIENAEKIETVEVLGWQVVCKKGEFQVGQLVSYIQIDTIVPEKEEFEFLRERHFRVRTIKLRGQISQGLVVPLPSVRNWKEGDDLTDALCIKKYEKVEGKEQQFKIVVPKNRILKFIFKLKHKYLYKWLPSLINMLEVKYCGEFPSNLVPKTDEERIQNRRQALEKYRDKEFIASEKLDGSSITLIYTGKKGRNGTKMRVASRNQELFDKDNEYFQAAYMNGFNGYLEALAFRYGNPAICIQGELIGKPQGNRYNLYKNEIRVFNIYIGGRRLPQDKIIAICSAFNIPFCPVVFRGKLSEVIGSENFLPNILKMAEGKSVLNKNTEREGLVFRCLEDNFSFKVISNCFLIKNNE